MIDEFWQAAYICVHVRYFESSNMLVPLVNAQTGMAVQQTIGKIMSHAWLYILQYTAYIPGFMIVRISNAVNLYCRH